MKKILFMFFLMAFMIQSCFALDYPRWKNLPVKVYIPQGNKYTELMTKAFNNWEAVTNGVIKFKYVNNQDDADIYVVFVRGLAPNNNGAVLGLTHYAYSNGFYTKNYIEIATAKIYGDKSNKQGESIRIYQVMLHEIGHAIGLEHSDNVNSIMYYLYDKKESQQLTPVDIANIRKKYL